MNQISCLLCCALFASACVTTGALRDPSFFAPEPRLVCTVEAPTDASVGAPIILAVTITNASSTPFRLLNWSTPFAEGRWLSGRPFEVTRDGERVQFLGTTNCAGPGIPPLSSYTEVTPGKPAVAHVDLAFNYEMKRPGRYRAQLGGRFGDRMPVDHRPRREGREGIVVGCNPVEILVRAP